jgi:hypothetical protein
VSYGRPMTEQELAALASWIANVGLEGSAETTLIEGFCGRAVAAGLPLARAIVFVDTLHPIYEGWVFRWERDKPRRPSPNMGEARKARPPSAGVEVLTTSCWKLANR